MNKQLEKALKTGTTWRFIANKLYTTNIRVGDLSLEVHEVGDVVLLINQKKRSENGLYAYTKCGVVQMKTVIGEVITVDKESYVKSNGNKWTRFS